MDQELAVHPGYQSAKSLLSLVVRQLGATTGMLTVHDVTQGSHRIITRCDMSVEDADAMALLVNDELDLWQRPSSAEGGRVDGTAHPIVQPGEHSRISFPCHVAPSETMVLTACNPNGRLRAWSRRAYLQLKSWIEPSLDLLWHVERERSHRAGLMQAIDRCDFGFLLLDSNGVPLLLNLRAKRLLEAGDGIRRAGHTIAALNFEDTLRLQSAIRYEAAPVDDLQILLLRRSRLPPLTAVVASLAGQSGAVVALYIVDPERDRRAMISAWCRVYGLTATEATLAQHLAAGATVEEAARRMRVQKQTARAYLRQVFAKTETNRQAQLVGKILGGIVEVA